MADMSIGERIRHLRKLRGWSLEHIASLVGVDRSQFGRYETGKTDTNPQLLLRLAEIFQVPLDYLYGLPTGADTDVVEVPVLGRIPAGRLEFTAETVEGTALVPSESVRGGRFFFLRVHGDCMAPQIPDGSLALVRVQPEVENGEIAVVTTDSEEGTLKRVYWFDDGRALLRGDNPTHTPIVLSASAVRIVGRVTLVQHSVK
jgi:repressor LexA